MKLSRPRLAAITVVIAALASTACSSLVGPDYTRPEMITPDAWHQQVRGDLGSSSGSLDQWWTRYRDPALVRLVETARKNNLGLQLAAERIVQARALRRQSVSPLLPNLVGDGGLTRSRTSENGGLPVGVGGQNLDLWSTGFDASWEIDFFGALRRGLEAALANEAASLEQYRDVLVALDAETTLAFLELRTAEARAGIVRRNLKLQQDSLELARNRFEAGLVPEIDVTQATANLETTRATLPALRQQRAAALNRLAVLIGAYPADTAKLVSIGGIPVPARATALGLPADLLRKRPDVRAAERLAAAQNARIGVAMGDLYPRFSLNGSFNLEAVNSGDLLDSGSRAYGFGPSLRLNLFNAGLVRNRIAAEQSKSRQAVLQYKNAVLQAVSEVETNMAAISNERDRLNALDSAVEAARKTVELVQTNYADGLVNFQNVLDAQRVLLQAEDSRAASRGQIAAGYARLYKSLGGGVVAPLPATTDR